MSGDQRGQFVGGHPVQPADPIARSRGRHGRGLVLAVSDHRDLDGCPGQPVQRGTDDRRPLQGGVQAVEHHPQRPVGVLALSGPGRQMPRRWCAHRYHHRPDPMPCGQAGQVLLGVHDDDVGGPQRGRVDRPQQEPARDPAQSPVPPGVTGPGEMVEHHRYSAKQQPGQVDVEMTEVADQHHIRCGRPARGPGQGRPALCEADQQSTSSPRVRQHVHSGRGVQTQRRVAFGHVDPAGPQPFGDRGDPRVHRGVISTKQQSAHDSLP